MSNRPLKPPIDGYEPNAGSPVRRSSVDRSLPDRQLQAHRASTNRLVTGQPIVVIGASGRFVARSALRASRPVSVIDLFGDHDTDEICKLSQQFLEPCSELGIDRAGDRKTSLHRVSSLQHLAAKLSGSTSKPIVNQSDRVDCRTDTLDCADLRNLIGENKSSRPPVIIFTGGAENHPALFDDSNYTNATIAGPSMRSISRLLDPEELQSCCRRYSIPTPATVFSENALPRDKTPRWLRKNLRSGGGLRVTRWEGANRSEPICFQQGEYLQNEIDGPTVSGCFVAVRDGDITKSVLLGCCTQHNNLMQDSFRYPGSCGLTPLADDVRDRMNQFGANIARHFDLVGVFGIDFVLSREVIFLVDINPRIPASAEIIERSYAAVDANFTVVQTHLDACLESQLPQDSLRRNVFDLRQPVFSKRIVYWDRDPQLRIDARLMNQFLERGDLTDLPPVGSVVLPGHPLSTLHCAANDFKQLRIVDHENYNRLQRMMQTHLG